MLDERFVIVGVVLALATTIQYAYETLKGRTKPNRVTWFLWALAPAITFAAQLSEHIGIQALLTFGAGFGPLLVLVASLANKKAYWQITRFDLVCGGLSVLALILWLVTGEGTIVVLLSIGADFLASLPTLVKAYRAPETESAGAYLGGSIAGFITLLTVQEWTISNYAFALYLAVNMGLIGLLVAFPKFRLAQS